MNSMTPALKKAIRKILNNSISNHPDKCVARFRHEGGTVEATIICGCGLDEARKLIEKEVRG